ILSILDEKRSRFPPWYRMTLRAAPNSEASRSPGIRRWCPGRKKKTSFAGAFAQGAIAMMKKALVGSVAAATLSAMMFGGDAVSYVKTGFSEVHEAVRAEVPVEFEIERARHEVEALVPEIHKSLHVIAKQQVEVENLKETITHKQASLEDQEEAILALNEDLK